MHSVIWTKQDNRGLKQHLKAFLSQYNIYEQKDSVETTRHSEIRKKRQKFDRFILDHPGTCIPTQRYNLAGSEKDENG